MGQNGAAITVAGKEQHALDAPPDIAITTTLAATHQISILAKGNTVCLVPHFEQTLLTIGWPFKSNLAGCSTQLCSHLICWSKPAITSPHLVIFKSPYSVVDFPDTIRPG